MINAGLFLSVAGGIGALSGGWLLWEAYGPLIAFDALMSWCL